MCKAFLNRRGPTILLTIFLINTLSKRVTTSVHVLIKLTLSRDFLGLEHLLKEENNSVYKQASSQF